ncbi:MAG: SURF1 family protein, partial [Actinomycetota bacterium]
MPADWRFARQPFWLFSHVFAGVVVVSFVALGLWQLDRLGERRDANRLIEDRTAEVLDLDTGAIAGLDRSTDDGSSLDYQAVVATVRTVESDLGRIVNRSGNGVAGEHVVAVVELADGTELAVNRGFLPLVPVIEPDPLPSGPVVVTGWLRATVERGWLGATDDGTGDELPRFDTERVASRLGRDLPPVWLQLDTVDGSVPSG